MSDPEERIYKIVRTYENTGIGHRTIRAGLTLSEAQAHCRDPETSSATATGSRGRRRTQLFGAWRDGYTLDVPRRTRR